MNETVEMVRVYNNGNRDGSDDEGSLCLPIPPMKPFSYVRLVRGWLNMDVAEANEPRTIAIGCDPAVWSGRSYPNNAVNNRRYSLLSFLPLALFYHFRSVFNVFYLLLSLSQLIPALKVGFIVTYFSPLVFVLLLSLIKDAVDDIQRYRRDQIANKEKVEKTFSGRINGCCARVVDSCRGLTGVAQWPADPGGLCVVAYIREERDMFCSNGPTRR
ncbi:putative phospholipid-translocating ATPase [Trypanosoma cruzi]|uniref:Putative phospholipid-translocating ATPase n=1 Tax=Trypanosoma cruzi TaxID=5693 RepID=A0A2V2UFE4_TRYCR|nr:putative phospholipid-translocating ATPase [Trypanosoma cruzi]